MFSWVPLGSDVGAALSFFELKNMEKSLEKAISLTQMVLIKYDGLFACKRKAVERVLSKRNGIFSRA